MLPDAFWTAITRFGEAQILLPAALVLALWFAWRADSKRLATTWLVGIAAAVVVTTVSKVAFIGYGVGWPALDFTGVSGHSMFAASIYPLVGVAMASALAGPQAPRWQPLGLLAGVVLALLVGVSRVVIGAHSWSEVLAGLTVGGAATAAVLSIERMPVARPSLWLPVLVSVWLGGAPANAPPSTTHGWVTRVALSVSGRSEPYTRRDMLAAWHHQQGVLR